MSAYNARVTIAVPEAMINEANHLACLLGECAADFTTFKTASYQDSAGNLYAACSTPVKPVFFEPTETGVLPEVPPHGEGLVDPAIAQQAFDTLNQSGGILMIQHEDGQEALAMMGLEPIPQTDTTTA